MNKLRENQVQVPNQNKLKELRKSKLFNTDLIRKSLMEEADDIKKDADDAKIVEEYIVGDDGIKKTK